MRLAGMRWYLSQRLRRFRRARPDGSGRPSPAGIPEAEQKAAIEKVCALLNVTQVGEIRRSTWRNSIGFEARDRDDGFATWIKIVGSAGQYDAWAREGERSAQAIAHIPKPTLLRELDWSAFDGDWYAMQFSLAPSPVVQATPWIAGPHPVDAAWLNELRTVSRRLSAVQLSRWLVHPGTVVRILRDRYGNGVPTAIDEWRTAHGDMNWSNLTAPTLTLLDWERWGAAPRGYDAATILAFSVSDPELVRRIESVFADDLETPSGLVSRLYAYALRLKELEERGPSLPADYDAIEKAAARLLRYD